MSATRTRHAVVEPRDRDQSRHCAAADSVGLLSHPGINAAYVLGASLGGAIAQTGAATPGVWCPSRPWCDHRRSWGRVSPPHDSGAILSVPAANSRDDVMARAVPTFCDRRITLIANRPDKRRRPGRAGLLLGLGNVVGLVNEQRTPQPNHLGNTPRGGSATHSSTPSAT